jgi:hypothetical protein
MLQIGAREGWMDGFSYRKSEENTSSKKRMVLG